MLSQILRTRFYYHGKWWICFDNDTNTQGRLCLPLVDEVIEPVVFERYDSLTFINLPFLCE